MKDKITARADLVDSGISSIAIAVLIAWTFEYIFRAGDATVRLIILRSYLPVSVGHPGSIRATLEITVFLAQSLFRFRRGVVLVPLGARRWAVPRLATVACQSATEAKCLNE